MKLVHHTLETKLFVEMTTCYLTYFRNENDYGNTLSYTLVYYEGFT